MLVYFQILRLDAKSAQPAQVTAKADVYSFGMLLYEVWTGTRPFEGFSEPRVALNVVNGARPDIDIQVFEGCPWLSLMELCWSDNADEVGKTNKVVD